MYEISIENEYGEKLKLTNNPNYTVTVTGLSSVMSNIITSPVANQNGERFVSSRQQKRNIVLKIYINSPIEANRIALYKYIKSHRFIRFYYKNGSRDVYIDGYVESFENDLFAVPQSAMASIICPRPPFIDVNATEQQISCHVNKFSFPFSIIADKNNALIDPLILGEYSPGTARLVINNSDSNVGFIYQMHCRGKVVNPMIYLEETGETLKLDYTAKEDDIIRSIADDGQLRQKN